MRKRSSYRPKPIIRDTVSFIKKGFEPITDIDLRIKPRSSFEALRHGYATLSDLNRLVTVSNTTTALSRQVGRDWLPEIRQAADAIEAMQRRYATWGRVQATKPELEAVRLLLLISEAQLDVTRVQGLEIAIEVARKGVCDLDRRTKELTH